MMRERDKEWTEHEKNVLLTLLQVSGSVIEKNRKLNSELSEWRCVQRRFQEMTGAKMSIEELRNKWEELKASAKHNLQSGKVSSSEYIKVLAICLGIYNEVDDFDLNKIRTELQLEFQPPRVSFEWDKSSIRLLSKDAFDGETSKKRKRKIEEINESESKKKSAAYLEEEFRLKKLNLERELQHQATRHELEIEILGLKKKIMQKRLDILNRKKAPC